MKKTFTVEELLSFCQEKGYTKFSAKGSTEKLYVTIPAVFETEENVDDAHRNMMRLKIKVFHTGLNRNGSHISEDAAKAAMASIKNRPLLAYIHQLDDGTWDFEQHNMEIIQDEDGNEQIEYKESQVGSFSEEEPFFEYDEENKKNFVCAYAWVSEEYTKAAEIIRRKNGTKNSCELCIDEFSYNAKEKYLDFEKFYVEGSTFLGCKKNGKEIGEGMLGSRADIADFSENGQSKLIETLEKLNSTLSNFNINTNIEEGGKTLSKFEELLAKYNKVVEDITFEYEGLTDEELEIKFAEEFDEQEPEPIKEPANEKFQKVFEISHEDIRYALYSLLSSVEEQDNEWYFISGVYDDHFAYESWDGGKIYGQKYSKEGDNVSFEGERYSLYRELLTESEYEELKTMRSNYASIKSDLEKYQTKEEKEKKDDLFISEEYKNIFEEKEFIELKDNHEEYSLEELTSKLDGMLLSFAKSGTITFAEKEKPVTSKKNLVDTTTVTKKKSRYGSLFRKN